MKGRREFNLGLRRTNLDSAAPDSYVMGSGHFRHSAPDSRYINHHSTIDKPKSQADKELHAAKMAYKIKCMLSGKGIVQRCPTRGNPYLAYNKPSIQ